MRGSGYSVERWEECYETEVDGVNEYGFENEIPGKHIVISGIIRKP